MWRDQLRTLAVGVQMLFVAFGALVLVPLLTGMDPSIALFTAGLGTLLFQLFTKRMVPIFLASSFAFIAPIQYSVKTWGMGPTVGGLVFVGLAYIVIAGLFKLGGMRRILRYLPPVVTGPVIIVIGLGLAPVAVKMAVSLDGSGTFDPKAFLIALVSLSTAIVAVSVKRPLLNLIPIICGIAVGYAVALVAGVVDFTPVQEAAWFCLPWGPALEAGRYAAPVFEWAAILFLVPVVIAPSIEHVGDILAISTVTGNNYIRNPGLHRTLFGDGVATATAGLLGGPPCTTYSEVTGAVALTRAFNPTYMTIAAVTAVAVAFVGKLGAVLRTVPTPVMGGILLLLFGMIASIGIGNLVRHKVDFGKSRNLVIVSIVVVAGVGNLTLSFGTFNMGGIGLAGVIGVLLNLLLPGREEHVFEDEEPKQQKQPQEP